GAGGDVGDRVVGHDGVPRGGLDLGEGAGGGGRGGLALARGGRVALQFGVDGGGFGAVGVDQSGRRQGGDDAPAQVGVDGETGQSGAGGVGVEQGGQHVGVPRVELGAGQRVDEGELVIRPGLGGAGQFEQPVGEGGPALLLGPAGIGVAADGGVGLHEQPLHHADLGLGADAAL